MRFLNIHLYRYFWTFKVIIASLGFVSQIGLTASSQSEDFDTVTMAENAGIKLLGSIASDSPSAVGVILVKFLKTNKIKALRTGNKITLKEQLYIISTVHKEFIIVSRGVKPKLKRIKLVRKGFSKGLKKRKRPKSKRPPKPTSLLGNYREDGFERDKGEIRITKGYRDQVIKAKLGAILMQASATPVMSQQGGIEGFEIDQIEPGSIFEKAGLRNLDVVTAINNTELNNITGAVRLLQSLKNASSVNVEFKRNGTPLNLNISVD